MKKNISINISGIIFYIDEDGYEVLKEYLESISSYFASFDDSGEIVADIESRIAEIFLSKLNETKQVITAEDVESLKATMGSIRDFQAIEEEEPETSRERVHADHEPSAGFTSGSKRLYRDGRRKVFGGVAAGFAHYFNVDPLWIRIIWAILALASYGIFIIAYFVFWVLLPESVELADDKKVKKMFRDPDQRVLGGVASGIAKYFGIDLSLVRILFVLLTPVGGLGFFAYIVFWIVLPVARTLTDKMQMEGEPVTLSNIESTIKDSLNVKPGKEENILVKILLFPFRLIAIVLNGIAKALGPAVVVLVEFIRVIVGVVLSLVAISLLFAGVVVILVVFGLTSGSFFGWPGMDPETYQISMEVIRNSFPVASVLAASILLIVPALFMLLLGVSVIAKRIIFNAVTGWVLFVSMMLSIFILIVQIPAMVYNFKEDGEVRHEMFFSMEGTPVLKLNERGLETYTGAYLSLSGYEGTQLKLEQVYRSQGFSRLNAAENAGMISYQVNQEDSVLYFDSNIQFKEGAIFRAQHLQNNLYIPYNQPFTLDYGIRHLVRRSLYSYGYMMTSFGKNTFMFTEDGLECLSCESRVTTTIRERRQRNRSSRTEKSTLIGEELTDFQVVRIFHPMIVEIRQGDSFKVEFEGTSDDLSSLDVYVEGDALFLRHQAESGNKWRYTKNREAIRVLVQMPVMDQLDIRGASKVSVSGFEAEKMIIKVQEASEALMRIKVEDLDLRIKEASRLELRGSGTRMRVHLSEASELNAFQFKTSETSVEAHTASTAKVYVTGFIDLDAHLASTIRHRGGATVRNSTTNFGNVKAE
jgi:phage shock protein PspC (stress-responsive transcriptional regulator)